MSRSALPRRDIDLLAPRFSRLLRAILSVMLLGMALTEVQAQQIKMKSAQFDPLAGPVTLQGLPSEKLSGAKTFAAASVAGDEMQLAIVQWAGVSKDKLEAFKKLGGKLIAPIPPDAYIALLPVGVTPQGLSKTLAAGGQAPRWAGAMAPEWKLDPRVSNRLASDAASSARYLVQIAQSGGKGEGVVRATLKGLKGFVYSTWEGFEIWAIEATASQVESLARLNGVFWIEPQLDIKLLSERSGMSIANQVNSEGSDLLPKSVTSYAAWLNKVKLHGDGVVVQIMDDGLGQGTVTPAHPDLAGRIAGINDPYSTGGMSRGGHGHLNASIIMGKPIAGGTAAEPGYMKDPGGYLLGQGVAPNARIYATKLGDAYAFGGLLNLYTVPLSVDALIANAINAKAVISSNSWGGGAYGYYDTTAQLFDRLTRDGSKDKTGFQQMIFVFSAGNSGIAGASTVGSPATAKNVVSVGAGENSDKDGIDGSLVGPDGSNDLRDIADFSSRGPLADGRFAPTLFAPGTHIAGAASDYRGFTGATVSGRLQVEPGETSADRKYYPAKQNAYTWSSGTSHSAPAVAGALALLYEYFNKYYLAHRPAGEANLTPALAKAMLVAGAVDTAGGNRNFRRTNDIEKLAPVPNNDAGWGRCSLADLVEGTRNQFFSNQDPAQKLTFTGQTRTFLVKVADPSKPLKIVLSWTDAPGSPSALKSLVNDLDLIVTCTAQAAPGINRTYYGNVFSGGWSTSGGAPDTVNNTECVFIKKPVPGIYKVTVVAKTLLGNALNPINPTADEPQQDFALFALNGKEFSDQAQISFDQDIYRSGQRAIIALADRDLVSYTPSSAPVTVTSKRSDGSIIETEAVVVTQKDANSGFLYASLPFTTAAPAANGVLSVAPNSLIEVTYADSYLNADGRTRSTRTAYAKAYFDSVAPQMISQEVVNIGFDKATIKINTNEMTNVTVNYGAQPSQISLTRSSVKPARTHEILLSGLQENRPYFYDIIVSDPAGNAVTYNNPDVSGTPVHFAFQTMRRLAYYNYNFDNGSAAGWTAGAPSDLGVNDWILRQGVYPDRPLAYAWTARDTQAVKDASLVSPAIVVKPGSMLQFYQWYNMQKPNTQYGFDGGVLEVTTDNGLTWQDIGHKAIPTDPSSGWAGSYDAYLAPSRVKATATTPVMTSPLGGRMAWTGRSWDKIYPYNPGLVRDAEWNTSATTSKYSYRYMTRVDVSEYAGHTVKFRFRIGCNDDNVGGDRWIVDDIQVYSPALPVSSKAHIQFDSPRFSGEAGQRIRFTLSDTALAASATPVTPALFSIATSYFPNSNTPAYPRDLKMIDPIGIWEGFLDIEPYNGDPNAVVAGGAPEPLYHGDSLTLRYADTNVGDGSRYVTSDVCTLDRVKPNLTANNVLEVRNHDFKIQLTTDEPATVQVRWGTSMQNLTGLASADKPATEFSIWATSLAANTAYYYTVTVRDLAGNTVVYDNSGYGFGVRTNQYNPMVNTLDPPNASFHWSADPAWTLSADGPYHSASKAWHAYGKGSITDNSLVLDLSNYNILDGFTLRFWHTFKFEPGLDGAVIEVSRDGGNEWSDLGEHILSGIGYNSTISWLYASPISGRRAWSGSLNGAWNEVKVDLSPFAGNKIKIRFRLTCDEYGAASQSGWHIDDLTLDTYDPNTPGFPSKPVTSLPAQYAKGIAYSSNLSLKWSRSNLAQRYQVWFGPSPTQLSKVGEVVQSASSSATTLVYELGESLLAPGTQYCWRVVAINGSGPVPGDLRTFKTQIIDPNRFAQFIVGKPTLNTEEKGCADYNKDGKIDVADLLANLKRR